MSPSRETQMRKTYPQLLETCPPFEVGEGWHAILKSLFDLVMWPYEQKLTHGDLPQVQQIKQKFGRLRVAMDELEPRVTTLVEFAEYHSGRTCERCGAPGTLRTRGWMRVSCDAHEEA